MNDFQCLGLTKISVSSVRSVVSDKFCCVAQWNRTNALTGLGMGAAFFPGLLRVALGYSRTPFHGCGGVEMRSIGSARNDWFATLQTTVREEWWKGAPVRWGEKTGAS